MPKCDGDWKNPGCNREAICVERDMDSKKILRYVCQGHAHSFNPYTEFAVLELKRRAAVEGAVAQIAMGLSLFFAGFACGFMAGVYVLETLRAGYWLWPVR